MAIWQCDIQLIPDRIVNDSPLEVEIKFTEEGYLDTDIWWKNYQPDEAWHQVISQEFPVFKSWSDEILMWGKEEGILFQVCVSGATVEEIGIRVDVRHLDGDKMKKMIEVIKKLQCHIYFMETQIIIPPIYEEFVSNLKNSRAVEFVKDPRGCLEKIGKDRKADQNDFTGTPTNDIRICDECGSKYYKNTSLMASLCPECAHILHGYDNCSHEFKNGRCSKCYWDGSTSDYINSFKRNDSQ